VAGNSWKYMSPEGFSAFHILQNSILEAAVTHTPLSSLQTPQSTCQMGRGIPPWPLDRPRSFIQKKMLHAHYLRKLFKWLCWLCMSTATKTVAGNSWKYMSLNGFLALRNSTKFDFGRGSALDPIGELTTLYQAHYSQLVREIPSSHSLLLQCPASGPHPGYHLSTFVPIKWWTASCILGTGQYPACVN